MMYCLLLWKRLLGKKVIFVTGTDEHGEKIATAAAAAGSSPGEHCDAISRAYKALWKEVQDLNYLPSPKAKTSLFL